MLIINSKHGIIYGLQQFIDFYNINPDKMLKEIYFENLIEKNICIDKIYIDNRFFNINLELIFKNDEYSEWILKIREICCDLSLIEFDIDSNYIINNFVIKNSEEKICENGCFNKILFEGKNIVNFNDDIYKYLIINKEIIDKIKNKEIIDTIIIDSSLNTLLPLENLILIDTIFVNSQNIEYLVYIMYNKSNDTIKIKCKSICDFLKEKIQIKVKKNISHNKNFFYHIFHEIRNYLNIISISTDNLNSIINNKFEQIKELLQIQSIDILDSEQQDIIESIGYIKDSSRTIVDIISDVLTLEKLKCNEIKIRPTFFMLDDLFNSCVYSMKTTSVNKDIALLYENKLGNLSIQGDYIRLKQVIINLISNAIKFTNIGGKVIFNIDFELEESGEKKIKFTVIDNGIGIKEENHKFIFKEFSQIDPDKLQNGGGTGLGLSIAKLIVDMHKGHINFNSNNGQGSVFYFTIPLIENEPVLSLNLNKSSSSIGIEKNPSYNKLSPNIEKNSSNDTLSTNKKDKSKINELNKQKSNTNILTKQKSNKNNFSNKLRNIVSETKNDENLDVSKIKLLFVDDNKTIQKLFIKILQDLKINNIFTASNGLEAFELYKKELESEEPFDIILMDQMMPIMDGNEAAYKIIELHPNAIIVGLTGNALIEQKEAFIKNGVREVYEKPITKEKLYDLLKKYYKLKKK